MTKLTVTVITYNEEKKIDRCLRSVKDVADEIIVVDSLSTDKTKEICLSHQVTFIEHPFLGYIEQKNFALSQATHAHVLSLDADEALSDELVASILREKATGFQKDGYSMNRLNNYCGQWIRHGDYYPDRKLRLGKKDKIVWGGENPHDEIIMSKGATIKWMKGNLLHYSFLTVAEHWLQMKKFSSISAMSMHKKGRKVSFLKPFMGCLFTFLRGYIIKLGFLDGRYGFTIARINAWNNFTKYRKLIVLNKKKGL